MARVVRALNEKGISILQTADSNISISLLIRRPDLTAAVHTLHDHFDSESPMQYRESHLRLYKNLNSGKP